MLGPRQRVGVGVEKPCDAEVQELDVGHAVGLRHQDVGRFEVAMDETLFMSLTKTFEDRNRHINGLNFGHGAV